MDILTLVDKGKTYETEYSSISVTTGRFVTCIPDVAMNIIEEDFENPGTMLVHNPDGLYSDQTYTGFAGIHRITQTDNKVVVVISKSGD